MNNEQSQDDLLLVDFVPLPDFPIEAIPDPVCQKMIKEVSEKIQIDAGFVAGCALGAISIAAQGKIQVDLLTHKEHANIYFAGILESGERKSPAANLLWKPIYEFENKSQQDVSETVKKGQNERKIKEERLKKLRLKAAGTGENADMAKKSSEILALELSNNPLPTLPYFSIGDVTTEKLAALMEENNGKMGILSSEGGIFDIISGLYNNGKSNIDLFLQAYSHDPVSVQRIGRPPVYLLNPSLTICLAIQPSVLDTIRHNQKFIGRGMLARFLFTKGKPRAGDRPRLSEGPDANIVDAYKSRVKKLMAIEFPEVVLVKLEPKAQLIFDKFYEYIELEMRWGGRLCHLKDWGNKLPGNIARLATLFHFFQYGDSIAEHPISVNIVSAVCVIGLYFMEHAADIFREINEPENVKSAKKILNYIRREKPMTFTGRDVMRHSSVKDMKDVDPGLQLLIERKLIYDDSVYEDKVSIGRPKSTQYRVNPEVFKFGVSSISSVGNEGSKKDLLMEYEKIMDGYKIDNKQANLI